MQLAEKVALIKEVGKFVAGRLDSELKPLREKIAQLEARAPEKGEPGERGSDGKDGRDGSDGAAGRDGTDGAPGEKGDPGERGADGRDGKDADPITQEQVETALRANSEMVMAAVTAWLAENPPPAGKDGKDGFDGRDGDRGEKGDKGDPGLNGKDGADGRDGLAGLPGRDGKDGEKGADGKDGLGFGDLVAEYDGERTFKLAAVNGDRRKDLGEFVFPVMIYRGIWREGQFKAGDVVTLGGSLFVAKKDTATKPETPDCDWQLAAKRGKDGRDGKNGERGLQGPKGEKGDRGDRGYGG